MKQNGPSSSSATSLLCAIDPFCNPVDLSTGVVALTTCSYYLFLLLVWVLRMFEESRGGVLRMFEESRREGIAYVRGKLPRITDICG